MIKKRLHIKLTLVSKDSRKFTVLNAVPFSTKISNRYQCSQARSSMFNLILNMLSETDAEVSNHLNPNKIIFWTDALENKDKAILDTLLQKIKTEPEFAAITTKMREALLSTDPQMRQFRRNAFYRLNVKEEAYIKHLIAENEPFMLEFLILLPRIIFSQIKDRLKITPIQKKNLLTQEGFIKTPSVKPELCFILTQILNLIGASFYKLLIKHLKNYDHNFSEEKNLTEEQQSSRRNNLAKYFLNSFQFINKTYARIGRLSSGYIIDFSCLYPADYFLEVKRYPYYFLPKFLPPTDLSEAMFRENLRKTIKNPYPGHGVIVKAVKNEYFCHLNTLQKETFSINKKVLDVLLRITKERTLLNKKAWDLFYPKPKPRIIRRAINFKGKRKNHFSKTSFYHNEAEENLIILEIAKKINDISLPFYYPYFSDSRGRIYPDVFYLNVLQNDLSRALVALPPTETIKIDFSTESGQFVFKELQLYGRRFFANLRCASEEEVLSFIRDNHSSLVKDLTSYEWATKKTPFQYLSWLLEYEEAFKISTIPEGVFYSSALYFYDAQASGSQLSVLLFGLNSEDPIYSYLNLISLEKREYNQPRLNDIYTILISYFLPALKEKAALTGIPELERVAKTISQMSTENRRKIAKTYLMKRLYGASVRTSVLDLLDFLNDKPEFSKKKLYYSEAMFVIREFEQYLKENDFKELFKVSNQLKNVWEATVNFCLENKNDLIFRNDKIKSEFNYLPLGKKMIQCSFLSLKKPIELVHKIPISNKKPSRKTVTSFLAHLVHTLDSAVLATTIILTKHYGESSLKLKSTLHDCFATSLGSRLCLNRLYALAYSFVFMGPDSLKSLEIPDDEKKGLTSLKDILECFRLFYNHLKVKKNLTKTEEKHFLFLDSYFNESSQDSYKERITKVFKKLNHTALLV